MVREGEAELSPALVRWVVGVRGAAPTRSLPSTPHAHAREARGAARRALLEVAEHMST
jgi:hypothetical protein